MFDEKEKQPNETIESYGSNDSETKKEEAIPIGVMDFRAEAVALFAKPIKRTQTNVLQEILDNLNPVDFRELADLGDDDKISQKHLRILTVQQIEATAAELNYGLCQSQGFTYVYNGEYWKLLEASELETFLGQAAAKLGVDRFSAKDYEFKSKLVKQFAADSPIKKVKKVLDNVLINLRNGTFEISESDASLRDFKRSDFLTYQLPFEFDETASDTKWQGFLDDVLPDTSKQIVLAEYVGYVFARRLKLEKTLILFGSGANGKSVFFDVIRALLGEENVSHCSLESLSHEYYQATLANKLLNYSSEISNRLNSERFKQLTSGEPFEARLPYCPPITISNYARLAFNCNELPRDVEHSEAFFRRFLIIEFGKVIAPADRNPNLAREITESELPGVFNWVLEGLRRLLEQQGFSRCEAAERILNEYRRDSDSVASFLDEEGYRKSENLLQVQSLYNEYKSYCIDSGYRPLGRKNFTKRLVINEVILRRTNVGQVAHLERRK